MTNANLAFAVAIAAGLSGSAQAAILSATSSNIAAVFATAFGGDTIKLNGSFGSMGLANRTFTSTVTMDATNAVFNDSLSISNVSKLAFVGGTFGSATNVMRAGRAVGVYSSSYVTFAKSLFVGNGSGMGLTTAGSKNISVSAVNFKNLRLGLGITASNNVRISSSRFTGMTSDGINIAGSHRVTAISNRCSDNVPDAGAHPDCIQLWSIAGTPVQSDITLTKNFVTGPTQGLTSFNPDQGGGLRITITNNIINTSFPQGIACYGCIDSVITGNTLTTLPGAQWKTTINVVGGRNNIVSNNSIAAQPATVLEDAGSGSGSMTTDDPQTNDPADYFDEPLPDFVLEDLALLDAGFGNDNGDSLTPESSETMFAARGFGAAAAAVPEPAVWAQLVLGFALTGFAVRRRPGRVTQPA